MFYIALIILVIYLFISFKIYRLIPNSISDTFYLGNKWWFTAVMIILGFLITASLLIVTPEMFQFAAFFTGAGLLFVGAAPHFKDSTEKYIHFGGAGVFGIFSLIWSALYCSPWLLLTWLAMIPLWKTEQRTFWIELVCIINIVLAYLL